MNVSKVSATHARNNFFELLDQVGAGKTLIIEKDKKIIAKLVPHFVEKGKNKGLMKAIRAVARRFEYSEKENPLRRPGAADFLGKWDKRFLKSK